MICDPGNQVRVMALSIGAGYSFSTFLFSDAKNP
jgi:hypothetical protein